MEPVAQIAHGQDNETVLVVQIDAEVRADSSGTRRELGYAGLQVLNRKIALGMLGRTAGTAVSAAAVCWNARATGNCSDAQSHGRCSGGSRRFGAFSQRDMVG